MKFQRSLFAALLAISALGTASVAQARSDVTWSIGVGLGVPGVQVYGGYPQPVYVQPAPVYYQPPPPVYYQPAPVYLRPAPVYYQPQPVYVQPQVVYPQWGHRGHHRGWDEGRGRGHDRGDGDGRGYDWRR